jgi:hypothetical protein
MPLISHFPLFPSRCKLSKNMAPKAPVSQRIPHLDGTAIQFNQFYSVFLKSLRRERQPVKSLRGVGEGVGGAERRSGGGDGAAQAGPVARTQVRSVLQLIPGSRLLAPRNHWLWLACISGRGERLRVPDFVWPLEFLPSSFFLHLSSSASANQSGLSYLCATKLRKRELSRRRATRMQIASTTNPTRNHVAIMR